MFNNRRIGTTLLLGISMLPLWGGTGRPSDGLLSFVLLLGFLLLILGILQVAAIAKKWAEEVLDGLY